MRPIAAVRLARVALHLLRGLVVSLIVMPHATHALRDAIRLRWSKKLLRILGVKLTHEGQSMAATLIVANHISWLDVFVIHAVTPAVFVCKAEVKHWPLIGPLVRACGTLFIERGKNRAAATAAQAITQLLNQGRSVAIFPEGTTSDGRSVLPFRSALIESSIHAQAPLQPVAIQYNHPAPIYVGDTTLWQSLCAIANAHDLTATVQFLPAVDTAHAARGLLAEHARSRIIRRLPLAPHTATETSADLPADTPSATRPTNTPNPAPPTQAFA